MSVFLVHSTHLATPRSRHAVRCAVLAARRRPPIRRARVAVAKPSPPAPQIHTCRSAPIVIWPRAGVEEPGDRDDAPWGSTVGRRPRFRVRRTIMLRPWPWAVDGRPGPSSERRMSSSECMTRHSPELGRACLLTRSQETDSAGHADVYARMREAARGTISSTITGHGRHTPAPAAPGSTLDARVEAVSMHRDRLLARLGLWTTRAGLGLRLNLHST